MRISPITIVFALIPALALVAGCGTSSLGGGASDIVPSTSREPAAHLTVPALADQGTLAVGVPAARPTVVNMWASWCGPCRKEMPALQRFAAGHPGVRVIGVAVNDQMNDARAFATAVGVRFPLGFDIDHEVADAYAVTGLPTTVILDRQGRVAVTWPGPISAAELDRLTAQLGTSDGSEAVGILPA